MPRHKKIENEPADDLPAVNEVVAVEKPAEPKANSITITYLGDPQRNREGPENPTFARITMPKGKPVTIDDAAWIEKFGFRFRRNRHFHVE